MATSKPSYVIDAPGQLIRGVKCKLASIQIITNGTNDVAVDIHDVPDASTSRTDANKAAYWYTAGPDRSGGRDFVHEKLLSYGCYVVITGTGGKAIIDLIFE